MRKPAMARWMAVASAAALACVALAWSGQGALGQTGRSYGSESTRGSDRGSERARAAAKPWLGVYTQDGSPELREALDLKDTEHGALVTRVVPDSPADRAGLKRRDYIVRFDSQTVNGADELSGLVQKARVGQTVSLEVIRDGQKRTLGVRLAARPAGADEGTPDEDMKGKDDHEVVVPDVDGDSYHMRMPDLGGDMRTMVRRFSARGRLGVRVEDLNADLAPYFGAKEAKGALVLEVTDDSPAKKAGFKAGDVIVQVGDEKVEDAESLMRALRDKEGATKVTVLRKGQRMTLEPKLEAPEAFGMRAPARLRVESGTDRDDLRRQLDQMREELRQMKERLDKLEKD